MKVVRKKKERAKELEGIDMSNIVSSSRRRTSSSYIPLPKPKIEVDSDEDDEDEENEEDTDDDNEDDVSGSGGESDEGMGFSLWLTFLFHNEQFELMCGSEEIYEVLFLVHWKREKPTFFKFV